MVDNCVRCSGKTQCVIERCTKYTSKAPTARAYPVTIHVTCIVCEYGYKIGEEQCVVNTSQSECADPNCQTCENKDVCTACNESFFLTPAGTCASSCAPLGNYYEDANDNKCKPCHTDCATCLGKEASQCTSCPAGKALKYTSGQQYGTCGEACKQGTGDCDTCGANIGGTDYCSKCNKNTEFPLNGECAVNSRAAFCKTPGNGVCSECEAGFFLFEGGCYETSRQPGKAVCSAADTTNPGKCTTCANQLPAGADGSCKDKQCHPTCATCSGTEASKCKTCAGCLDGYTLCIYNSVCFHLSVELFTESSIPLSLSTIVELLC